MDGFFVDPVLYTGRDGEKCESASAQAEICALLDRRGISYSRADHAHADTIAQCVEIEKVLGAPICKNLFLRSRQATEFYLLLLPGDKPFRTAVVSKLLGVARLSFAEPEYLSRFLGLTPGSVSILGLANDRERRVHLVIDRAVADKEWLGCHPMINTSTLKLSTRDIFEKFLPYTGHVPILLDIPDAQ